MEENISMYSVSTLPADGLAVLDAGASAGAMMTKFKFFIVNYIFRTSILSTIASVDVPIFHVCIYGVIFICNLISYDKIVS